jgi:hypothetical protein
MAPFATVSKAPFPVLDVLQALLLLAGALLLRPARS